MTREEEAESEKRKQQWAEARGLNQSPHSAPYCICRLLNKRCRSFGGSDCVNGVPGCDHPSLWLRGGKAAVLVFQPYGITDVVALGRFCAVHGLECLIDTWPAWHYPNSVLHVELCLPTETEARRKHQAMRREEKREKEALGCP